MDENEEYLEGGYGYIYTSPVFGYICFGCPRGIGGEALSEPELNLGPVGVPGLGLVYSIV